MAAVATRTESNRLSPPRRQSLSPTGNATKPALRLNRRLNLSSFAISYHHALVLIAKHRAGSRFAYYFPKRCRS